MAFDREGIKAWLSAGSGYPGLDAMAMRDDYSKMGEEDCHLVREVLHEWLQSRDQKDLGNALWFLTWAHIDRFEELEPDLLALAEWLATQSIPEWGNTMTECGSALADLGSRQVIPILKLWAKSIRSSDHFTAGTAEHSAGILLWIDRQEGLVFAPAILRGDLKFRRMNFPTHGKEGWILFTDHFMRMYIMRYPAEARDLGLAYRNMKRSERAASLLVFERVIAEHVRVEKMISPEYSQLIQHGITTPPDDWGAEALVALRAGMGL